MKYNDETQRVTRRNIAVSLGLAILLVALILVSAVIYGCNRPQKIVKPPVDTPQPEQPGDVTNDIGDELSSGIVYPMPKSMLFSSPTSESAVAADGVTLQATVLPSNAADLSVNWTVAFVNPSAAWAAGKNPSSYVAVVPSSPGSAIATVTCLKAFGEQIVIEVSSLANPDAAASCIVDYHWRFQEPVITVNNGSETSTLPSVDPDDSQQYSYELSILFGDDTYQFGTITVPSKDSNYTVNPTNSPATVTYSCYLRPDFLEYLNIQLDSDVNFSSVKSDLTEIRFNMVGNTDFWLELEDKMAAVFNSHGNAAYDAYMEAFLNSGRNALQLEVHVETAFQTETFYYVFRVAGSGGDISTARSAVVPGTYYVFDGSLLSGVNFPFSTTSAQSVSNFSVTCGDFVPGLVPVCSDITHINVAGVGTSLTLYCSSTKSVSLCFFSCVPNPLLTISFLLNGTIVTSAGSQVVSEEFSSSCRLSLTNTYTFYESCSDLEPDIYYYQSGYSLKISGSNAFKGHAEAEISNVNISLNESISGNSFNCSTVLSAACPGTSLLLYTSASSKATMSFLSHDSRSGVTVSFTCDDVDYTLTGYLSTGARVEVLPLTIS